MVEVVPTDSLDPDVLAALLLELAAGLRATDLDEIAATSDLAPLDALLNSVLVSALSWVVLHEGDPVAVFGVAPTALEVAGSVWMLGTSGMDAAAISILRLTRPYLLEMHRRFPLLWNYIDARNEKSMAWLRWCGFRLLEAHPNHGREGRLFFTFARYEPHV